MKERYREKLPGFWIEYTLARSVHLGLALHVTGSKQYLHPLRTSVPISVSQLLQSSLFCKQMLWGFAHTASPSPLEPWIASPSTGFCDCVEKLLWFNRSRVGDKSLCVSREIGTCFPQLLIMIGSSPVKRMRALGVEEVIL